MMTYLLIHEIKLRWLNKDTYLNGQEAGHILLVFCGFEDGLCHYFDYILQHLSVTFYTFSPVNSEAFFMYIANLLDLIYSSLFLKMPSEVLKQIYDVILIVMDS